MKWVSTCKKDLEEININLKFEKNKNNLKIIKSKIPEIALKYVLNKRGSKGKEMLYKLYK